MEYHITNEQKQPTITNPSDLIVGDIYRPLARCREELSEDDVLFLFVHAKRFFFLDLTCEAVMSYTEKECLQAQWVHLGTAVVTLKRH